MGEDKVIALVYADGGDGDKLYLGRRGSWVLVDDPKLVLAATLDPWAMTRWAEDNQEGHDPTWETAHSRGLQHLLTRQSEALATAADLLVALASHGLAVAPELVVRAGASAGAGG